MATTHTDQFWVIDPASPPGQGEGLKTVEMTFLDRDDDGRISRSRMRFWSRPGIWSTGGGSG